MSASQSNLSSPQYGYDFVVATTQASINSGLLEYLASSDQPTTYLCFLADQNGNPTVEISLDDLMSRTGGVDPFQIPAGTPWGDPRIAALTKEMFVVGIQVKMGLPPGVLPRDLPPVVDLSMGASNVRYNTFCSEFVVIQNNPPSGFGGAGSWFVWSQPAGQPVYFTTSCNLTFAALPNELNTPYFNNNPDQQKALLAQLENLSGSAFSLQQLLFDLDSAAVQSQPTIEGLDPGSAATAVLTRSFLDVYFGQVQAQGQPVFSVQAVVATPDASPLRLTGVEREVGQFVDGSGNAVPLSQLTGQQRESVTLDHLCAANNNPLPGATSFTWNWVDPTQLDDISGVLALNRTTMAAWLYQQLLPTIQKACIKPYTSVTAHALGHCDYVATLTPNQTPQSVTYPDTGNVVLEISYASNSDAHDSSGATSAEVDLHSTYTCSVSFAGNTITTVQHLLIWLKVRWDLTSADGNIVDVTLTDTYTLSVDQNGELQATPATPTRVDNSQHPDFSGFVAFLMSMNGTDIQGVIDNATALAQQMAAVGLTDLPVSALRNFVFPGANVFTFKDVAFSNSSDLVTSITYVQPS